MKKILLDAILLALFIAELSFNYLPKMLHEVLGVAMAVAIVVHLAINFRRFTALFKKITSRKFFSIEVDVALLLGTLIILFTGVCMSNHLFPDAASSALRRNMTIHNLHTSAPYILMVLIGIHLGLHWQELQQRLLNFSGAKIISRVVITILAAGGLLGLFLNRFLDRILMKHIFATPATDLAAPLFVLLMLGGVVFFALITFLFDKKIFRHQKIFGG